jgi:hypothetical protein
LAHRNASIMPLPLTVLLSFRDSDGRVRVETVGSPDDFADLVDPTDGSVRHAGPFAMHGGEWKVASVSFVGYSMCVECVSTADVVADVRRHIVLAEGTRRSDAGPPA